MSKSVSDFYNTYGEREWERLDADFYARVMFRLHMDFIGEHLAPGTRVLDAGCGAGRYAVELARRGCRVTLLDISGGQLAIAREKLATFGLSGTVGGVIEADIRSLPMLAQDAFDLVICFGAPLSYVLEGRERAIAELTRVLRPGGVLAVSVNARWGILKALLGRTYLDFFSRPDYWHIPQVVATGDLPEHGDVDQPARHFFDTRELRALLEEGHLREVELAAAPCLMCGSREAANILAEDEAAARTLLELELASYRKPDMLGVGEFLLGKGRA